jgi:predicted phosphodiesterase
MRIQLLSDLHFEFHRDSGRAFVETLDPSGVDVLVLAGDIAVGEGLIPALGSLCRRYRDAVVLFVPGNHEYYGSDWESIQVLIDILVHDNPNLFDMNVRGLGKAEGTGASCRSIQFWGATLWFPETTDDPRLKGMLNDFSSIAGFEPRVYRENARARDYLTRKVRPGDVVITHHLPSELCVHPRHLGGILNPFFVSDMTRFILERKPALWLHGHTHESVDRMIGETRVVCNPFGYAGGDLNLGFNGRLIIEV